MSKLKHTPGPWNLVKNMPGFGKGIFIARRHESEYWNDGSVRIAGDCPLVKVYDGFSDWENKYPAEANAKLIAAAPELLEALKIAQQYMNVFIIRGEEPLVGENLKTDSFKVIEAIKKATE